ncbi:hypothetical protein GCM10023142_00870 [Anaerocolumna aminovalerica]|uniref:Uncharacterized protein n=1 Tax=Anaerocolumna aminovalerica TaxID=1527 RepID=A0A1I5HAA2_9FIRM|nr:hypothetical protein [Anaerocolumna aminovalerica]MDU6266761.1 hypothetical protein [Anaerocolumna aminovalerica]SFO45222.1 hypothetical protein SAMN04489757_12749 [Anaerocolumna aminovalerica]
MAKCKVCGSEFQGESEYCENCFKEKKDFSSESYLDGLLKGMVNQPNTNQHINIKKKASIKNDTANDKVEIENNAEQEENNLENIKHTSEEKEQLNNDVEDILALIEEEQDILALEEDGDINEAVNAEGDSNSEILSLHNNFDEDMNEEENTPDYQESSNKEDNNSSPVADFDTMNEADDDLVALLGMITGLEESVNENREDIFALEENEDNWNQESLKNTSVAEEKSSESKGSQKEMGSIEVQEQETGSIKSNNDLLNDILSVDNIDENTIQPDPDKNPGDLGEIFSDSLSAIYSLNDQDLNVENITLDQPENREEVKKKKWEKVFGSKKAAKGSEEGEEPKKKEKVKKSKKKKTDKSKTKAVAADKDNLDQEDGQDTKKAAKEKKLKDKKDAKAKKENAKKENAKKKAEAKKKKPIVNEVLEEEDTGRISKAGTSFALIFCGLAAAFVIVGANLYTYSINIKKAELDFERQRYTDAYYEIYGYKVKPKDMELHNKIMTVMYVNKQLNSYYNYTGLNKQPEALDSLLKGLARYEENIDTAISLGIEKDMDDLKSQILAELDNKYNIKEKEALAIVFSGNQEEYTQYILNTVAEKTN